MLLFAVALIVGMQIDGGAVDLFGLIVLALLVNLVAALFAFGVAFRLRTIQAGPAMQMPVFLILFFAPVYVPLALLAGWVEAVAKVNPFTALVEGGRDLISGQPFDVLLAYGIAAALGAVFCVWAVRGLRKAEAAGAESASAAAPANVNGGWVGAGFGPAIAATNVTSSVAYRGPRDDIRRRTRPAQPRFPTQQQLTFATSASAPASSPRRRIPSLR